MKKYIGEVSNKHEGYEGGKCKDATPKTSNCLDCFQQQFFGGNKISYDCEEKRNIYVARYFPVHVKENTEALNLLPQVYIEKLFKLKKIYIMNIGGGPGSDSFAVKNFFIDKERVCKLQDKKEIYILRVDKETNWNDMAGFVNERIKDTDNIKFNSKRSNFDVGDEKQWTLANRKYNLFTISYFLSEIEENGIEIVAKFVNQYASDTVAAVIINDNDYPKIYTLKQMLFESISCNVNNVDYERADSTTFHCDFFYKDEDRDLIKPKLSTKSIRYAKVVRL